jgi:hypothetical protein
MRLVYILDQKNGLLFNKRRQSKDSILIDNVIQKVNEVENATLWLSDYSRELFVDSGLELKDINELSLAEASDKDFIFIEDVSVDIQDVLENTESNHYLYLYKWNKVYPADRRLDVTEDYFNHFEVLSTETFEGNSHEEIYLEEWRIV